MINFFKRVAYHKRSGFSWIESFRISFEVSVAIRYAIKEIGKHHSDDVLIKAVVR
jgi:hypothetical protein